MGARFIHAANARLIRRCHAARVNVTAPSESTLGICAVALSVGGGARGVEAVEQAITTARHRGAQLIVFPEAALGGYLHETVVEGTVVRGAPPALEDPDSAFARLRAAAGDAVVCVGWTEAVGEQRFATVTCLSGTVTL